MKIVYLILGLIVTAGVPLGLLKIAIWFADKNEKMENPTDNKEYCIVCGEDTTYLTSDHIDERNYYVEGAGQLCEKCYYKILYKEEYGE